MAFQFYKYSTMGFLVIHDVQNDIQKNSKILKPKDDFFFVT